MKRKILLTSTFIIIGGILLLYYLNKRIEGVWINHYSTDLNGDNRYYDWETLTTIKNQKFYYHNRGNIGVPIERKYFDSGIRLIFRNTAWEKVSSINKDSLVIIRGFDQERLTKTVMKRVPDSLKNDSDWNKKLQGKTFKIHIPINHRTDTIVFDDQLIWTKNGHRKKEWHNTQGWEVAKIDGFDILFSGNWPTQILKETGNEIKLYSLGQENFIYAELNELVLDSMELNKFMWHKKKYAQ